jgi:hypothetical protein
MPCHSRARVTLSESAEKQIDALTDEAELLALDRALAVLSVALTPAHRPPAPTRACTTTATTSRT